MTPPAAARVTLRTTDGVDLDADVHESAEATPRAGVVLSHPHPHHGGTRHHPLLVDIATLAVASHMVAIRHDFRSGPADTIVERADVAAAVSELRRRHPGLPVVCVGYSFGALVALGTVGGTVAFDAVVAIAPPLRPDSSLPVAPGGPPIHLIVPRHDQFCPPSLIDGIRAGGVTIDIVEGADHFLAGHIATVASLVIAAVDRLLGDADVI